MRQMTRISFYNPLKSKIFRQGIASLILIAFALTQPFLPQASAQTVLPLEAADEFSPAEFSNLKTPEFFGHVVEYFKGRSKQAVILIQDAHAIPEAQKNIQNLIEYFQREQGLRVVGLEGAASRIDPGIFRSFPDQERLKNIFQDYYDRGELTGGNAAAIFSPLKSGAVYQGVENWELYEEGLAFYLQAVKSQKKAFKKLAEEKAENQKAKAKNYSKKLLDLDLRVEAFYDGNLNLIELLEKLAEIQKPDQDSELDLLLRQKSSQGGGEILEAEVKQVAGKVKASLLRHNVTRSQSHKGKTRFPGNQVPGDLMTLFNQKRQAFQTSQLSSQDFALFLKELIQKNKLPIPISKKFSGAASHQQKIRDIKGTYLFEALERYAERVKASLFQGREEARLNAWALEIRLLEQLAKLEISHRDWAALQSVIQRRSQPGAGEKHWTRDLELLQDLKPQIAFYENARKRDLVFHDKLLSAMKKNHQSLGLLVAGGFHAEGLIQQLKADDISYLLVMPKINQVPEETSYAAQMRGDVSWKNYFEVKNGKVNLYDAFVRGARDKLLKSHRVTGSQSHNEIRNPDDLVTGDLVTLKSWRDQILRDLSDQGRLSKASQSTRFLDEVVSDLRPETSDLGLEQIEKFKNSVEGFIQSLLRLEKNKQLTEQNIFNLLKNPAAPTTMEAAAPGSALALRTELRTDLLPGLNFFTQEKADVLPVSGKDGSWIPENKRSEMRKSSLDDAQKQALQAVRKAYAVSRNIPEPPLLSGPRLNEAALSVYREQVNAALGKSPVKYFDSGSRTVVFEHEDYPDLVFKVHRHSSSELYYKSEFEFRLMDLLRDGGNKLIFDFEKIYEASVTTKDGWQLMRIPGIVPFHLEDGIFINQKAPDPFRATRIRRADFEAKATKLLEGFDRRGIEWADSHIAGNTGFIENDELVLIDMDSVAIKSTTWAQITRRLKEYLLEKQNYKQLGFSEEESLKIKEKANPNFSASLYYTALRVDEGYSAQDAFTRTLLFLAHQRVRRDAIEAYTDGLRSVRSFSAEEQPDLSDMSTKASSSDPAKFVIPQQAPSAARAAVQPPAVVTNPPETLITGVAYGHKYEDLNPETLNNIRRLGPEDLDLIPDLVRLFKQIYGEKVEGGEERFRKILRGQGDGVNEEDYVLGYFENGRLLGYRCAIIDKNLNKATLIDMAIDENLRGRRIGRHLYYRTFSDMEEQGIERFSVTVLRSPKADGARKTFIHRGFQLDPAASDQYTDVYRRDYGQYLRDKKFVLEHESPPGDHRRLEMRTRDSVEKSDLAGGNPVWVRQEPKWFLTEKDYQDRGAEILDWLADEKRLDLKKENWPSAKAEIVKNIKKAGFLENLWFLLFSLFDIEEAEHFSVAGEMFIAPSLTIAALQKILWDHLVDPENFGNTISRFLFFGLLSVLQTGALIGIANVPRAIRRFYESQEKGRGWEGIYQAFRSISRSLELSIQRFIYIAVRGFSYGPISYLSTTTIGRFRGIKLFAAAAHELTHALGFTYGPEASAIQFFAPIEFAIRDGFEDWSHAEHYLNNSRTGIQPLFDWYKAEIKASWEKSSAGESVDPSSLKPFVPVNQTRLDPELMDWYLKHDEAYLKGMRMAGIAFAWYQKAKRAGLSKEAALKAAWIYLRPGMNRDAAASQFISDALTENREGGEKDSSSTEGPILPGGLRAEIRSVNQDRHRREAVIAAQKISNLLQDKNSFAEAQTWAYERAKFEPDIMEPLRENLEISHWDDRTFAYLLDLERSLQIFFKGKKALQASLRKKFYALKQYFLSIQDRLNQRVDLDKKRVIFSPHVEDYLNQRPEVSKFSRDLAVKLGMDWAERYVLALASPRALGLKAFKRAEKKNPQAIRALLAEPVSELSILAQTMPIIDRYYPDSAKRMRLEFSEDPKEFLDSLPRLSPHEFYLNATERVLQMMENQGFSVEHSDRFSGQLDANGWGVLSGSYSGTDEQIQNLILRAFLTVLYEYPGTVWNFADIRDSYKFEKRMDYVGSRIFGIVLMIMRIREWSGLKLMAKDTITQFKNASEGLLEAESLRLLQEVERNEPLKVGQIILTQGRAGSPSKNAEVILSADSLSDRFTLAQLPLVSGKSDYDWINWFNNGEASIRKISKVEYQRRAGSVSRQILASNTNPNLRDAILFRSETRSEKISDGHSFGRQESFDGEAKRSEVRTSAAGEETFFDLPAARERMDQHYLYQNLPQAVKDRARLRLEALPAASLSIPPRDILDIYDDRPEAPVSLDIVKHQVYRRIYSEIENLSTSRTGEAVIALPIFLKLFSEELEKKGYVLDSIFVTGSWFFADSPDDIDLIVATHPKDEKAPKLDSRMTHLDLDPLGPGPQGFRWPFSLTLAGQGFSEIKRGSLAEGVLVYGEAQKDIRPSDLTSAEALDYGVFLEDRAWKALSRLGENAFSGREHFEDTVKRLVPAVYFLLEILGVEDKSALNLKVQNLIEALERLREAGFALPQEDERIEAFRSVSGDLHGEILRLRAEQNSRAEVRQAAGDVAKHFRALAEGRPAALENLELLAQRTFETTRGGAAGFVEALREMIPIQEGEMALAAEASPQAGKWNLQNDPTLTPMEKFLLENPEVRRQAAAELTQKFPSAQITFYSDALIASEQQAAAHQKDLIYIEGKNGSDGKGAGILYLNPQASRLGRILKLPGLLRFGLKPGEIFNLERVHIRRFESMKFVLALDTLVAPDQKKKLESSSAEGIYYDRSADYSQIEGTTLEEWDLLAGIALKSDSIRTLLNFDSNQVFPVMTNEAYRGYLKALSLTAAAQKAFSSAA